MPRHIIEYNRKAANIRLILFETDTDTGAHSAYDVQQFPINALSNASELAFRYIATAIETDCELFFCDPAAETSGFSIDYTRDLNGVNYLSHIIAIILCDHRGITEYDGIISTYPAGEPCFASYVVAHNNNISIDYGVYHYALSR